MDWGLVLTMVAGVTTKLATPVDTISTVSGTNLLMNCPVVDPSFCEYTPAASATRATRATAALLTILIWTCIQSLSLARVRGTPARIGRDTPLHFSSFDNMDLSTARGSKLLTALRPLRDAIARWNFESLTTTKAADATLPELYNKMRCANIAPVPSQRVSAASNSLIQAV